MLEALGLHEELVVRPRRRARARDSPTPPPEAEAPPAEAAEAADRHHRGGPYQLPSLDLLRTAPPSTNDGKHEAQVMEALGHTLTTFGVDARVVAAHRGPTVTMYEVEVAAGTKVNKVLNLSSDIAYALATPDVRIIAPIPGRSAIGIEVPNKHRDFVMLGDILRSKSARDGHPPAVRGAGQGHPRRGPDGEPRHDAARADRRRHRRREVQPRELLHHVAADAHHARRRPPRADRPQAGGDVALRGGAAPAEPGDRAPQARRRGAAVDLPRDGAALRDARHGGRARHRRLRGGPARPARSASRSGSRTSTSTCRSSWW